MDFIYTSNMLVNNNSFQPTTSMLLYDVCNKYNLSVEREPPNNNVMIQIENIYKHLNYDIIYGQILSIARFIDKKPITLISPTHTIRGSINNTVSKNSFFDTPTGCGKTFQSYIAALLNIIYHYDGHKKDFINLYNEQLTIINMEKVKEINAICIVVNPSLHNQSLRSIDILLNTFREIYPDWEFDLNINPKQTKKLDYTKYNTDNKNILIIMITQITKIKKYSYFTDLLQNCRLNTFIRDESCKDMPFCNYIERPNESLNAEFIIFKNIIITSATIISDSFGLYNPKKGSFAGEELNSNSLIKIFFPEMVYQRPRNIYKYRYNNYNFNILKKIIEGGGNIEETSPISLEILIYIHNLLNASLLCNDSSLSIINHIINKNEILNLHNFTLTLKKIEYNELSEDDFIAFSLRLKNGFDLVIDNIEKK